MTLVQRLVILVVLALAPVLFGVAFSLAQLREIRTQETRTDTERLVTQVDAQHRRLDDAISQLLTAAAIAAPHATEQVEACAALRAKLITLARAWLDLMVLGAAGIVRCTTIAGTLGADRASVPEAALARTRGDPVLGTLERQAFQTEASLQAALAWSSPEGMREGAREGARGVVLATIRPASFLAPMLRDFLPAEAAIVVADRLGHVLYAMPQAAAASPTMLPPALITASRRPTGGIGSGITSTRATWLDGSDRLVAMGPASAASADGIMIFAAIPNAAALRDLTRMTEAINWALGLTLLCTMLIAYWGGLRYIRHPLGVLTEAALRWRDGDQTARVRLPGQSEIAALGRVFDEMADATEQGERQIREAADLLNALIESSADAIFVKDREGCYMLVNSTFARVLGQDRAALVGMRDADIMGPELRARVHDIHAEILATGQTHASDLTLPPYDAEHTEPRILQTIYAPIRATDGSVIAVAGIARDVTDERRAATDLRAAKERAEAADESKTRFLAAASHDLRQPVQAAILFAGLIGEHATAELRKPAEQLRLVLNDLRAMLDSLFDVSRYDTQSMRADITIFPLQPLIDQSIATIAGDAAAKGLRLQTQPTPIWVRSDHSLLGRMLGNIVQNAVRYTVHGTIHITVTTQDDLVHIAVADSGPGIAPEDMPRIWQEFEQLHNPERDRRQGLGLGLAIVRRLSHILSHPVSVTSLPGQGTTFTIALPRAEPVLAPSPLPASLPAASLPGSLPTCVRRPAGQENLAVVVEDDPSLLAVLGMILEDHGWHAITAADTDEALALLRASPRIPDVILTDYRLRDGKLGSAAITAIRAQVAQALPAIILTGDVSTTTSSAEGPLCDAGRLGDVTVLRKPVAAEELVMAMERAIMAHAG